MAKMVFKIAGAFLLVVAFGMTAYNYRESALAGSAADGLYAQLHEQIAAQNDLDKNLADGDDVAELAVKESSQSITISNYDFLGEIAIPALSLNLPVINDWSYPKLKVAPCRYFGTIKDNNLIIAAHNYDSHFGKIRNMQAGNEIIITDTNGEEYAYEVTDILTLGEMQLSELMEEEGWDMTLFTCTKSGQARVVIRCVMKD